MTDTATKAPAEVVRAPMMSGHCHTHSHQSVLTELGTASHDRCERNGGGNRANPNHEFQPCPCRHHYMAADGSAPEVYECGGCGKEIIEAAYWPLDEDGDIRYTHIDGDGRALGEDCAAVRVSRNPEPVIEVVPEPVVYEPVEMEVDDDLSDFDEDDFSDLDDL